MTTKPQYYQQSQATEQERADFEEWYICNAFDYAAAPIGSRDCDLQWRSWLARAQMEN